MSKRNVAGNPNRDVVALSHSLSPQSEQLAGQAAAVLETYLSVRRIGKALEMHRANVVRLLGRHPEIRRYREGKTIRVHAGDWADYLRRSTVRGALR